MVSATLAGVEFLRPAVAPRARATQRGHCRPNTAGSTAMARTRR